MAAHQYNPTTLCILLVHTTMMTCRCPANQNQSKYLWWFAMVHHLIPDQQTTIYIRQCSSIQIISCQWKSATARNYCHVKIAASNDAQCCCNNFVTTPAACSCRWCFTDDEMLMLIMLETNVTSHSDFKIPAPKLPCLGCHFSRLLVVAFLIDPWELL